MLAEGRLSSKPSPLRGSKQNRFCTVTSTPLESTALGACKAWSQICSTQESPTLHPGLRLTVWPLLHPVLRSSQVRPRPCSLQRALLGQGKMMTKFFWLCLNRCMFLVSLAPQAVTTCLGQEQWLHARVEEVLDVTPVQGTEVLLAHLLRGQCNQHSRVMGTGVFLTAQ